MDREPLPAGKRQLHIGVCQKSSRQLSSLTEANQDKGTFPLHAGVSQNSSLLLPPRPPVLNTLSLIISTFCVFIQPHRQRWDVPVPWTRSKSRSGHSPLTVSLCKPVLLLSSPAKLLRAFSRPFLVLLLSCCSVRGRADALSSRICPPLDH